MKQKTKTFVYPVSSFILYRYFRNIYKKLHSKYIKMNNLFYIDKPSSFIATGLIKVNIT